VTELGIVSVITSPHLSGCKGACCNGEKD